MWNCFGKLSIKKHLIYESQGTEKRKLLINYTNISISQQIQTEHQT